MTGKRRAEGGLRLRGLFRASDGTFPLVTVVTTVRNAAPFIERAICSVLYQTYPNIEYIIIDGCSTDATLNKIEKYRDFLDYYISEPDTGLYQGMNKGIALASGDYVLVLNADDWYADTAVEQLVTVKQKKKVDIVSALGIEVDRFGELIKQIPMFPFKANVMMRMPLRHETMLISNQIYNACGFYDESYKVIADLKFTQQLYIQKISLIQLKDYILYFRKVGVASVLNESFLLERRRLLTENFPFLKNDHLTILANEYAHDLSPYIKLYRLFHSNMLFKESLEEYLSLNGVLQLLKASFSDSL